MAKIYQYPLKIDEDVMSELRKIAELEGRSINKQIEYIIRQYLLAYAQDNKTE